jgi:uncharacterized protein (TIGR02231 family)
MQIRLILWALLLSPALLAQNTPKNLKSRVERVTVFMQGAQLYSSEKVSLSAGTTDLVFEGVSPQTQPQSLQATASGDVAVMDVRFELRYAEVKTKPDDPARRKIERDIEAVTDSLVEVGFEQRAIQQKVANLNAERQVVVNNRLTRGDYKRDSLPLLTQSMDYLRTRLQDIDGLILGHERTMYRLNQQKAGMDARLARLQTLLQGNFTEEGDAPEPTPQIIVTVYSDRATQADVGINYYIQTAGWVASYDLRAKNNSTDIELNHKAQVWQQSGLDWKEVPLTLSTGNPNQSSIKPTLTPFYLNFFDQQQAGLMDARRGNMPGNRIIAQSANTNAPMTDDMRAEASAPNFLDGVADYTTVNTNLLRVEYEIQLKYHIKSDGKPHNVVIQQRKLPATYNFAAVPKLDPDVFLIARVTDWEELNLIPGQARLYFDGSYVGETAINPNSTNDTLQLNLGRDKSIVMKRLKIKDKSKEKIFGDSREVTQTYEITVRNTKNIPIRMIIEDQMPISRESDIKIEYLEDSKATFNENTGKLTWNLKLDPRETRKVIFSYSVKMPKDRPVAFY